VFAIDKQKLGLPVALGSACLTSLVVWLFLHHLEGTYQEAGETVSVFTVRRYIPRNTPIKAVFLQRTRIPKAYVEPGAITDAASLEAGLGHPRFRTLVPLAEGTPLCQRDLIPIAQGEALSQILPEHQVAVSFGVDAIRGLAGNIQPGDIIDVLHTSKTKAASARTLTTETLFESIPVIAVGKNWAAPSRQGSLKENEEKPDKPDEELTVLTVQMNPVAAVRLAEVRENETLSVILRAPGDAALPGVRP
jgi:Flp pilus assembly protein CpaB